MTEITKEEWIAFRSADKIQSKIEGHITEALKEIFIIYGGKLETWYYPGAGEGGMGEMCIDEESVSIQTEGIENIESEAGYDGENYSGYLTCEFPTHFLFLTIDEIKSRVSKYKMAEEAIETARQEKLKKQQKTRKLKKEKNPYNKKSASYQAFEHRFERLQHENGELHAWHCWCAMCDVVKNHCHSLYKIVIVDGPSDYSSLYPNSDPRTSIL